ncbi:MAG: DUF3365 domain-containing protein [Methylophilaceae bacterium]|nr:DUF3365 domain-containing protein [Methylophilaceae bacterium]
MKLRAIQMLLLLCMGQPVWAADDEVLRYADEARNIVQAFAQKLGSTLKQQLETGGPEAAISVCKQVAPALAAEYSTNGRIVKRVSLKPRNQTLGTPDAWETRVLQGFDRDVEQGKPAAALEYAEVMEGGDGRWFRYMKAIAVQPMCLQCHGQPGQIQDSVRALLGREYPNDQATGYATGAVRGAFSVRLKLD